MFAALLVVILIALSGQAMAQSTIFNIPTTDTVAKGKGYFEFDFLPQAPGTGFSRTYIYNPRLVVGTGGNVEVGVNFPTYNSRAAEGSYTSAYIQPNLEWKFFNNDDAGVAVAAGALLNTAMNHRTGQGTWGLFYGNVSKKVKTGDYGPRFTAGPYGIAADQDSGYSTFLGTRGGVILGYEQPIHAKASIVADWFSGKNSVGYFTPGISITLPGSGLLNVGYSVGNDSFENSNATKNRFFFAYYGVTF